MYNKTEEIVKRKEYNGIMELIRNGRETLALQALEEYLRKYPGNTYGLKEYAMLLRKNGQTEKALSLLPESFDIHIIRERALCFLFLGEYEKALEETQKLTLHSAEKHFIEGFCKVKLGLEITEKIDPQHNYRLSQALFYDKDAAIEHIKKHTKENGGHYFNENLSIEELYEQINQVLPKAISQLSIDPLMTSYVFYVPQVGCSEEDDSFVNHLKVATLFNTNNILTMFPIEKRHTMVSNNLQQMLQEQEPVVQKQKRKESQIEKFRRKFPNY